MLETSSQFLSLQQPCWPKSSAVGLNVAGVEKTAIGTLAVAVNTRGYSIRVLNESTVLDGGNLCPLW